MILHDETMKCSNCGDTRLQPGFHFCPGCGSIQEDGQNNQPKEQKIVPAVTSEHPKGDGTREKHDTGASKERVKSKFSVRRWFCGCKPC